MTTLLLLLSAACGNDPQNRYETGRVDRGPVVAKVTASGTLSALVTVQVGSQVTGRIKEILVDFNSPVTKGQTIARIDPQLFAAALDQTRANLTAARGELTKAKVQAEDAKRRYERTHNLFERKLIPQAELDTAQATMEVGQAEIVAADGRVAQAQAALHQAEVNLAYATIASPINGVVISRNVDVGQTVAASLQAPTLFVIAEDLRKMQVDTSVAEADIGRLQPGMTTLFTVDAFPSEHFRGTIRQIRNAAQTVQNVVTYNAVIDVENPELKLKPGMTANVTFIYAEPDDVLRLPNAALRFRPPPELLATAPETAQNDRPVAASEMVERPRGGEPGPRARAGVSLAILPGEFVAIMGPSGSGKSTLINIVGCLDRPSSGRYELAGRDVSLLRPNELAEIRGRAIGFVFQSFNLLARTSAQENVELPQMYSGCPARERVARAREALTRVGLAERLHHHPNQMSGGQQQRVALARAMVVEPRLILADEPTGTLDSQTSLEIMAELQALGADGMTVLLVTHEPDIAAYASRVIAMRDGRVQSDRRQRPERARPVAAEGAQEAPRP